ncbi:MAG: hypothetical protein EXR20_09880 [Bacteroidetes bacterium]|nr:hypothetical protein [Bacteroidota bacterium]PHX82469.1 MAG: hypothetical protein CK539_04440 [Flavobacteriales bacterium]
MKNFLFTITIVSTILLASCGGKGVFPGYDEADNGTCFKLIVEGTGKVTADTGGVMFLKINLLFHNYITNTDSILQNINEQAKTMSLPFPVRKCAFKGDFLDMFMRLHTGDSATFFVRLDSLKANYDGMFSFPPRFDTMKYIGFTVKVDSLYSRSKYSDLNKAAEKKQIEMMLAMQKEEASSISKYIIDNKITVKPTADGIYYIETLKGKGENITEGKNVKVMYTGKFTDGNVFDSNMKPGGQPLEFLVGEHTMIPGMEKAVVMMKKGGKGTVIIPSSLAYGNGGGQMKPYATLIFDIEVVDVTAPEPKMPEPKMQIQQGN